MLVWKGLLLVVAICSPGAGYDTSTTLRESSHSFRLPFTLQRIADKLTRWDAIYFVTTSSRGYLFEQEWAFGWGFTKLIALCTAGENLRHLLSKRNPNSNSLEKFWPVLS